MTQGIFGDNDDQLQGKLNTIAHQHGMIYRAALRAAEGMADDWNAEVAAGNTPEEGTPHINNTDPDGMLTWEDILRSADLIYQQMCSGMASVATDMVRKAMEHAEAPLRRSVPLSREETKE